MFNTESISTETQSRNSKALVAPIAMLSLGLAGCYGVTVRPLEDGPGFNVTLNDAPDGTRQTIDSTLASQDVAETVTLPNGELYDFRLAVKVPEVCVMQSDTITDPGVVMLNKISFKNGVQVTTDLLSALPNKTLEINPGGIPGSRGDTLMVHLNKDRNGNGTKDALVQNIDFRNGDISSGIIEGAGADPGQNAVEFRVSHKGALMSPIRVQVGSCDENTPTPTATPNKDTDPSATPTDDDRTPSTPVTPGTPVTPTVTRTATATATRVTTGTPGTPPPTEVTPVTPVTPTVTRTRTATASATPTETPHFCKVCVTPVPTVTETPHKCEPCVTPVPTECPPHTPEPCVRCVPGQTATPEVNALPYPGPVHP